MCIRGDVEFTVVGTVVGACAWRLEEPCRYLLMAGRDVPPRGSSSWRRNGSLPLTAAAGMDLSTSMSDQTAPLRRWHAVVESGEPALLDDLLADEMVFRSPAVFAPQEGKALTASYLSAAVRVLGPTLRYVSQWHDHASAVLEFEADLDGVYVQGVDMLRWNAEGKLVSFTVMVRPLRGLQKLVELMAVQLAAGEA